MSRKRKNNNIKQVEEESPAEDIPLAKNIELGEEEWDEEDKETNVDAEEGEYGDIADFAPDSEDEDEEGDEDDLDDEDDEDEDGISEEEDGEADEDDITEGIDEDEEDLGGDEEGAEDAEEGAEDSGDDDGDSGDEGEESEEESEQEHEYVNYADGSDSSEDETIVNTVGRIPMHWYDDFDHIGYDREGKKIMKSAKGDSLDNFLKQEDDPNFWRTIHDKLNDKSIVLSEEQMDLVRAIQKRRFPAGYDPYMEAVEFPFDSEFSIKNHQPSKEGFLSSKGIVSWEIKKVYQIAQKIRDGLYVVQKKKEEPKHFDLWAEKPKAVVNEWLPAYLQPRAEYTPKGRVVAPKQKLPGHAESYNPPEEYLFTNEEEKEWSELGKKGRKQNFIPVKYKRFRDIKQWPGLLRQTHERCLNLYLAPRRRKAIAKREWDYTKYLPDLPKPKDLRPFPTTESVQFKGHTERIRSISMSPSGEYFVTGSDDHTARVWEVSSGRCVAMWNFGAPVLNVAWNPVVPVIAASVDEFVYFVAPDIQISNTIPDHVAAILSKDVELLNTEGWKVEWQYPTDEFLKKGIFIILKHTIGQPCKYFAWHHKGDYFSTVCPEGISKAVHIHQLSKRNTQAPFKKNLGIVNCTAFHPSKPFFYVCTQTSIRVYNLTEQILVRKLAPSVKWISSIDIHPKGDNLLVSSYDRKVAWMDLDLSVRPYKLLKYHSEASRRAIYHKRFPLFATCSDDTTIHVFHGMVYDDLMKNPLIVPLKVLKGHESNDELGVLDMAWHPEQPWLFSVGADATIRLWT